MESRCVIDGIRSPPSFLVAAKKAPHEQGLVLTGSELSLLSVVRYISTHLIELRSLSFTPEQRQPVVGLGRT